MKLQNLIENRQETFFLILISIITGCFSSVDEDVLTRLEKHHSESFIREFKSVKAENVVNEYTNILYESVSSSLKGSKESMLFEKYDVLNTREQVPLIIYYWHQKLNSKDFVLEEYIGKVALIKKQEKRKEKEKEKIAESNYLRFDIGDTLSFNYPVSVLENGYRRANKYENPEFREFNEKEDLLIIGELLEKINNVTDDNKYRAFKMKVIKLNRYDTYFMMKYLEPNDTISIELTLHPSTINEYSR